MNVDQTTQELEAGVGRAWVLALIAHGAQVDKAGRPYSEHLISVADLIDAYFDLDQDGTWEAMTVAYLHDIVEDTPVTQEHLKGMGFSERVREAVGVLTRPEAGETYAEYIDSVIASKSDLAVVVKIADLKDHLLDTSSIPDSLVGRYDKALARLESAMLDAAVERGIGR